MKLLRIVSIILAIAAGPALVALVLMCDSKVSSPVTPAAEAEITTDEFMSEVQALRDALDAKRAVTTTLSSAGEVSLAYDVAPTEFEAEPEPDWDRIFEHESEPMTLDFASSGVTWTVASSGTFTLPTFAPPATDHFEIILDAEPVSSKKVTAAGFVRSYLKANPDFYRQIVAEWVAEEMKR